MRTTLWACAALAAALFAAPARADKVRGVWPPLPDGAKAVVLFTGADYGNYFPKGCNGRFGGAIYRMGFDRWLAEHAPGVQRIWISTGDNGPGEFPELFKLNEMYSYLGRVGYAFTGVGWTELRVHGADGVAALAHEAPVPVLSSNLRVHETGKPLLPPSRVLDVAGARVLFIPISPEFPERVWGDARVGTVFTIPPADAVREEIERQKGAFDRVVLVAATNEWAAADVLNNVPGIDVAVVAPNDRLVTAPREVHGVPMLLLAAEGRFLGRIVFGAGGAILDIRAALVREDFPIDPLTGEVISPADTPSATPAPD